MPFLLALLSAAHADLPPPPDYVETCTLTNVQKPGESCGVCSAGFMEPDICKETLAPQGYAYRCTAGTSPSVWTEIWCKAGEHNVEEDFQVPPQAVATPHARQGCRRSAAALLLVVMVSLTWLGRRPPLPPLRHVA